MDKFHPCHARQQASKLLASLGVDPLALGVGPPGASWDTIYAAARRPGLEAPSPATDHAAAAAMAAAVQEGQQQTQGWVEQFSSLSLEQQADGAAGWAAEYHHQQQQQGPNGWAEQFVSGEAGPSSWADEFQAQAAAGSALRQRAAGDVDALDATRRLADTLAASSDPKMRHSRFLQFLSKMSRGELILEDNQVG